MDGMAIEAKENNACYVYYHGNIAERAALGILTHICETHLWHSMNQYGSYITPNYFHVCDVS